ncbi:MAG: fused MFS/spermidine synthase [bacterium]|nr:fused MFS/spermidine synthase [bacterium]
MSLLSYLFPREVAHSSTKYNRDIRVIEERGKKSLLINGSRQSGQYIEMLWKKTCNRFGIHDRLLFKNILVLGVGGGSVIHLLSRLYPGARITAVDIDPEIIEIGKEFFGLDVLPNLRFVEADAKEYLEYIAKGRSDRVDFIVVDVFVGSTIPAFVESGKFLLSVRQAVNDRGVVVINFLRELAYLEKSERLKKNLSKIFSSVEDFSLYNNRFFFLVP